MKQFQAVLMILLSLSVFALGQVNAQEDDHFEVPEHTISVKESGDTTTMFDGGNIIYLEVKDSVLINFIDSTRITGMK